MNKSRIRQAAACCVLLVSPAAVFADGSWSPVRSSLSVYGDYLNGADEQYGTNLTPTGGGGGAGLQFNLPRNFFIDGSYQYNYLHDSISGVGYGVKFDQARGGGGMVFHIPQQPLDVFAKIEYVHFDNQVVSDGQQSERDNDDGVGYHIGVRTQQPGYALYASGGWLQLADNSGPEALLGAEMPLSPWVTGFAEYRYDYLRNNDNQDSNKLRLGDYRLGFRYAF